MAGANVPYNPVPTEQSTGGLGGGITTQSNAKDFGAQVSESATKLGDTAFDIAQKQQGIINETAMTNADADFAMKVGKIKGDYTSLTGMAAYNAFPQYQDSIKTAFQESRATLPPGAQRGFDMLAARSMANHVADGSSYATSQLKEANRDSYSNIANTNLQSLLDPQVAASKERSDYHLDTLKYAAQAQVDADHPGLKTDPETGTVSFDESTPEGKLGKAQLQQKLDTYLTQGYVNRFDTLAKHDVFGAYDAYQQEREQMPRSAQVTLDSSFAPKILNAHTQIATGNTINSAQQEHYDILTNPAPRDAIAKVLQNEGGLSPDGHAIYGIDKIAHPEEFAQASAMNPDEGKKFAENFYKTQYWDKKRIADLPPNTQTIVMDGVVNHYPEFGDKLIQAAKDGASPQALIDMRRAEYQRLADANPEKYGQNLQGWNNRLDNLETSTEGKKTYATNENGAPLSLADYYRTNSKDVLAKGDAYAEAQMPGDLALKRLVRQTLTNEMTKTISNETAQYTIDNKNVMRAINGELSKGNPPATEDELRALPGMSDLLDKVAVQDPKFSETIPTLVAKVARRGDTTNSPNGYDTIMRALEPHDYSHPNAISSEDHLIKQLGHSDGTGINMKDYNDAKPLLEADQDFKDTIAQNMKDITNANGNIDGKGQERALSWYSQVMMAKKANDAKGDKGLSTPDFIASIGEKDGPPMPAPPSRMQQISNWAKSIGKSDTVRVTDPNGRVGTIPSSQLDDALKTGYKKVE